MLRALQGLGKSLPSELFPLFTPSEFETIVCGRSIVDLDLLKSVTAYGPGLSPDDPHIR